VNTHGDSTDDVACEAGNLDRLSPIIGWIVDGLAAFQRAGDRMNIVLVSHARVPSSSSGAREELGMASDFFFFTDGTL
jgi:hypothetical protein